MLSDGGIEVSSDGGATARHNTTAEVLAEGHGELGRENVVVAFNAGSPLELTRLAVGRSDDLPDQGADVGGSLGEDAAALLEVRLTVADVGRSPGLVEVIEDDIGVVDDQVSVEMINQVVADGQVNPRLLGNEVLLVLGFSNNRELISRANTA